MEEENEQLDYDEDELEAARKKAKELISAAATIVESTAPIVENTGIQNAESQSSSTTAVTAPSTIPTVGTQTAGRPHRYYVNPNFNKNKLLVHSNVPNLPHPYQRPPRFYRQPMSKVYGQNQPSCYLRPKYPNGQHIVQVPQMAVGAFPAPLHAQPFVYQQQQVHAIGNTPLPPVTASAPTGHNIYINPSALNNTNKNSWDQMVDEFVRKNISANRRKHHSRSRSPSRNRSSSSTSSSSRSRSRSSRSSQSPKRKYGGGRKGGPSNGGRGRANAKEPQKERNEVKITHQTLECARAIGLDEEYLAKIKEQNRLRAEVMRRKQEHRQSVKEEGKSPQKPVETTSPSKRPKVQAPEEAKQTGAGQKLRPYLAVVVTNLKGVVGAEKKVEQLAQGVGAVKKIWCDDSDNCHVIFEKHEHAKQFMLQYHGKPLDHACIDVTLKKVFLNLTK